MPAILCLGDRLVTSSISQTRGAGKQGVARLLRSSSLSSPLAPSVSSFIQWRASTPFAQTRLLSCSCCCGERLLMPISRLRESHCFGRSLIQTHSLAHLSVREQHESRTSAAAHPRHDDRHLSCRRRLVACLSDDGSRAAAVAAASGLAVRGSPVTRHHLRPPRLPVSPLVSLSLGC